MHDSKLFYLAVGKNIKRYRTLKDYSLQDVAVKVGLTKKTIQRYENGEIKIDMRRISDIADALDVTVKDLTEGAMSYLGLDVSDLSSTNLPIVGKMSCGNGVLAYEEINGYEPTPKHWLRGGEYFYLRAKGDSMAGARINDGDLLLIRKQPDVENGEIAAVQINDEAVLKRVFKSNGTIVLQSENVNYEPIICQEGTVLILGKLKKIVIDV
ncbi:helix-turn-helix domain-containing protein [Paenibacillus melissococcoides]|uniref:Helix-turn-helix domain-containing protein n=1 Tax=Paenibacillus melissococcoides TaxID=2912268 RepID=A0ABM9G629_9BACL|nr:MULTISPECIES: XRE family transcriptional regulator [Paenibacillus]MEB9895087.1 XRE family transcriptional regulator [Bacillus cereus]CAH8247329.1 helix-turn-helix domain-containing protein [Paenibacillus melissococcoides]CAH8717387.1 helix-turn-helix domain-containing protein [Paenibacillus melissococcoides]CAH8718374.1 helix-turn-helix domain-containing protein [Paenibacillus melissococcoides]GIO77871.1 hypothetical protein J6TS7_14810 [Paenibacillus dendritiformis]